MEPTITATLRRLRSQQGCPFTGLRHKADRQVHRIRSHHAPSHIRVETVEGIVGELTYQRGNKVFQVVTPTRQGFAGFFASQKHNSGKYYRYLFGPLLHFPLDRSKQILHCAIRKGAVHLPLVTSA